MFNSYLRIALRSIWKNKNYVFINTFGLGIALACCITAYLLLAFNLEFDSHLKVAEVENLYRVHTISEAANGEDLNSINAPYGLAELMGDEIAGIDGFFRFQLHHGFVRYNDKSFGEGIAFADASIVELFPMTVLKGSISSFSDKSTIILSEKYAEKYFRDEDPVGKTLTFFFDNQHKVQATVGAIVKDVPVNSSISFNILMRTEHFLDTFQMSSEEMGDWRDPSLLVSVSSESAVSSFAEFTKPYVAIRNQKKEDAKVRFFSLEPFLSVANDEDVWWSQINLRMSYMPIMVFLTMAGMILLIACFNLTNTTIATTSKRMKEVGVRKVVGANRRHLVAQFLLEIVIIILLSVVVGLAVSNIIVDQFTSMWNMPFGLSDISGINLFFALLLIIFLTALLVGLYPALRSSSFTPIQLMKQKASVGSYTYLTKVLVGLQFAISVLVLLNGLVFLKNTKFQESIDFGFNLKNVMGVFIQNTSEYEVMKARLASLTTIENLGITHHQLGMSSYGFPAKIDTAEYNVRHVEVGEQFFQIMELKLVEGRFLDFDLITDHTSSVVVNEAFVALTQLQNEPLSQYVTVRGQKLRIVGVVKNHVDNLFRSAEQEPFIYYGSKPNEYKMMLIQSPKATLLEVKDEVEMVWNSEFPDKPFQADFQEDLTLGGLRQTNDNLKKIFLFLTILGGLLSISGIYALATLHTERRVKEIGIRKTLGGSVQHIVMLLSKEFIWILSFAVVLGLGLGYFMSTFLLGEIYAYHVSVDAWTMLVSGTAIFLAGALATSMIIYRSAASNPVNSLRDE